LKDPDPGKPKWRPEKREKVPKVKKLQVLNENPDNSMSKGKEIDLTATWLGVGVGAG
jgi:hypothetical protein